MTDIIQFLKDYKEVMIAVFSTVLGMISTLITTHYLKALGNVKLISTVIRLDYVKSETNEIGDSISLEVFDIKEADAIDFIFKLTFYNSSDMPKALHSVQFEFIDDGNNKLVITPNDESYDDYSDGRLRSFKVELIETNPKTVLIKYLHGHMDRGSGLNSLKGKYIDKVFVNALLGNGRKYRKKIYDRKTVKN